MRDSDGQNQITAHILDLLQCNTIVVRDRSVVIFLHRSARLSDNNQFGKIRKKYENMEENLDVTNENYNIVYIRDIYLEPVSCVFFILFIYLFLFFHSCCVHISRFNRNKGLKI